MAIAYPTPESLLPRYSRRRAREIIASTIMDRAKVEAAEAGRSLRCREGDHVSNHPEYGRVGCRNDGSTCICECHDRAA